MNEDLYNTNKFLKEEVQVHKDEKKENDEIKLVVEGRGTLENQIDEKLSLQGRKSSVAANI